EIVCDLPVNVTPFGRDAGLARVPVPCPHGRPSRPVKVGVPMHQHRGLAAELEKTFHDTGRGELQNLDAARCGTGKRSGRAARVLNEGGSELPARSGTTLSTPGGKPASRSVSAMSREES